MFIKCMFNQKVKKMRIVISTSPLLSLLDITSVWGFFLWISADPECSWLPIFRSCALSWLPRQSIQRQPCTDKKYFTKLKHIWGFK